MSEEFNYERLALEEITRLVHGAEYTVFFPWFSMEAFLTREGNILVDVVNGEGSLVSSFRLRVEPLEDS